MDEYETLTEEQRAWLLWHMDQHDPEDADDVAAEMAAEVRED